MTDVVLNPDADAAGSAAVPAVALPVETTRRRVLVIGSGWHFTSGISYYTCRLANALLEDSDVSVLLMRRLVPRRLYPGHKRVGQRVNAVDFDARIPVFDGVDWYWAGSIGRAVRFMREQRPDVVVLQWWTGAVLHTYLRLAAEARLLGARLVVEMHEVHDTGEARLPLVSGYVRTGLRRLLNGTDSLLVHSEFDRKALEAFLGPLDHFHVEIAPHGPYDHVLADGSDHPAGTSGAPAATAPSGRVEDPVRLLFFGTIRPYKGLEDLVTAYARLPEPEAEGYRLDVVGETWEGWTGPLEALAALPHQERIRLVNRYVTDAEVSQAFAAADIVVLPYLRSSSSGPLHIAMAAGLPVVVTEVGGLTEAVRGYEGAVLVPPGDPEALLEGIRKARTLVGQRFVDPRSWSDTTAALQRLFDPPAAQDGEVRPTSVTVVIACFDEKRYDLTMRAVRSVQAQEYPHRLTVVVDHNPALLDRLRAELGDSVQIVPNERPRGASGARNTGAINARTDFVAFLDDDAFAERGWLGALVAAVTDETIVGAGGLIRPVWEASRPRWFPPEFGWVVGASIPSQDRGITSVRNVWAGSMIVRADRFRDVGGFRDNWGKKGLASEPEDTELCLRMSSAGAGGRWCFVPDAVAQHRVPSARASLRFFVRRCWSEGRGKAAMQEVLQGHRSVLTAERRYLRRLLPGAVGRDALLTAGGDLDALRRIGAVLLGTTVTTAAYLSGRLRRPASRQEAESGSPR